MKSANKLNDYLYFNTILFVGKIIEVDLQINKSAKYLGHKHIYTVGCIRI